MSLKEKIKEFIGRRKENKEKFKEMEEDFRLNKKLENMQKSADERELEKYMDEDRKKKIKKMLDGYRKRKLKEFWHEDLISQKNIFKNKNGCSLLKQRNIFK